MKITLKLYQCFLKRGNPLFPVANLFDNDEPGWSGERILYPLTPRPQAPATTATGLPWPANANMADSASEAPCKPSPSRRAAKRLRAADDTDDGGAEGRHLPSEIWAGAMECESASLEHAFVYRLVSNPRLDQRIS